MIKLSAPDFTVSIRINPPSLVVTSEAEVPEEFWLPQPPKLNKKVLLEAINDGWAVPGAVCPIRRSLSPSGPNSMTFARPNCAS